MARAAIAGGHLNGTVAGGAWAGPRWLNRPTSEYQIAGHFPAVRTCPPRLFEVIHRPNLRSTAKLSV
jgi:hypothetical protein